MDRVGDGWGKPWNLGSPINAAERALYPSITKEGTLYFQSRRQGGYGKTDIYRSQFIHGKYTEPENLGDAINSEHNEGDVCIAHDESYMIVCVSGRPDSYGRGDLYISFRREDGSWTNLRNMGETINTHGTEYCPMFSPEGKYFFFTSSRTGNGDIYWVDAKIIQRYTPEDIE